eukprot:PhM_4_TR13947/c2_g3_i1/m.5279
MSSNRRGTISGWKDQHNDGTSHLTCDGAIKIQPVFDGNTSMMVPTRETGEIVYCTRFSPDGKYLAATYSNGTVRIYEDKPTLPLDIVQRFKPFQSFRDHGKSSDDTQPITSVAWRPRCTPGYELVTTDANGSVHQWTWNPPASIEHQAKQHEEGNEILCCEYNPEGTQFVTAGSDRVIRLYDTMSGREQAILKSGVDNDGKSRATHTNRIFSVRFVTPQVLISAGWESAIQIWDMRIGKSIRQFAGTRVCSDALDVNFNTTQVIVACYRPHQQLMLFDYLSGREIPAPALSEALGETHLNCARLGADQRTLWCVGAKPNEVVVMDISTAEIKARITGFDHTLFTCQLDPKAPDSRVVLGGAQDQLYIAELGA